MDLPQNHFRHIMLFYFKQGKTVKITAKEICAVYGQGAVSAETVRRWFVKFKSSDFSLEDKPRPGRPSAFNENMLQKLIVKNPRLTVQEIAEELQIPKSTIHDNFKKLGFISRYDIWVPHNLTEKNRIARIMACESLLKRNEDVPFLRRIITGDEKWVQYKNVTRKRSWGKANETPLTTPKADLHPRKVLLSVWWDFKGIVHYELLPRNQTINSEKYSSQLADLKAAIDAKRPELAKRMGVVLHHDNARPHVSLIVRQVIQEYGWDLMVHPPYSPDIAPSDYHLFRSLQNSLSGREFDSLEAIKTYLDDFFDHRPRDFYQRGIFQLPDRWRRVIQKNGSYFV